MRTLSALLLSLLAVSCASPGSATGPRAGDGSNYRVTVRLYDASSRLELVGESHTDRVELYSSSRTSADTKVQSDDVMGALVEQLGDLGFRRFGRDGRAPSAGGRVYTRAIEIDDDGAIGHWAVGPGSADDERIQFNRCLSDFVQLYNLTASFQVIDNNDGKDLFGDGPRPLGGRSR